MEKQSPNLSFTLFQGRPEQHTVYVIPTLVGLIYMEYAMLFVYGLSGIMVSHHAPRWSYLVFYVVASFALHLGLAACPRLCLWLRQRIKGTASGLTNLRLLQTAAVVTTGGSVLFLWRFL